MALRKKECCSNFSIDNLERVQTDDKYKRVKLVCASCKRYYKFDTSEKNKEIHATRKAQIDALIANENFYQTLTIKQKGFLHDVYDVVHPTVPQLNFLEGLVEKHKRFNVASS